MESTDERGEEEVEGGGEGVGEDGGEAVAGGEVEHLHPAVAGVALVPGALPQGHLRLVSAAGGCRRRRRRGRGRAGFVGLGFRVLLCLHSVSGFPLSFFLDGLADMWGYKT